jgi:hypothetical protein
VRRLLDGNIPTLTDNEIEESLWYYYFDVEKTVNYILGGHHLKPSEMYVLMFI